MAHPSLLGLPRELRDKIYRFLLVSECSLRPRGFTRSQRLTNNLPTQLLSVSKQLLAEATQVIIECHTIRLGSHIWPFRHRKLLSPSLLYASRLDIKITYMQELPQLAAFLVEHHGVKDLHINFDLTVRTDEDLLNCREPYNLLPLGRLRLPGKVEFRSRLWNGLLLRGSAEFAKIPEIIRSERLLHDFLKCLEDRVKGHTPLDDPTPLFEGQDMSRSIG